MARFTYTAEKANGEIYKGVADAADRFEVYGIIRREGGHLLFIEQDNVNSIWSLSYWNAMLSHVSEYEKILFARNLGAMLSAGLSLARALSVMERQTKNAKMSIVLSQIASDVRRGDTLHSALAKDPKTFPRLFVAMVRAGEEGGDLSQSLQVIADQTERMYTLKKKIRGALIYPSIILLAIGGVAFLMMTQVVPTLAKTFEEVGAELPASTQIIIGISNFLTQHTFLALALIAGFFGAIYAISQTERGHRGLDFIFLRIPMIGEMVREVNAARTSRTLSSLLSSGVDIVSALDITGNVVQNSYFKEVINEASSAVAGGQPLSAAFMRRGDLYPAFVGEMMAVGEETGQIADMMKRLALFYEDEVDRKTKDMSTIIEPFLMILIGVAVGFFAVSMIMPIYQLSENI
ncbi:MAG: type II secretion system F family protein [Patescibacteria group bacterium]